MKKHIQNFKKYCPDRFTEIENYEQALADNFIGWNCHHKLGECCFTKAELKQYGLYENRTPGELIFLTNTEHARLHRSKQKMTDEHKRNISKGVKGKRRTLETRLRISAYQKTKVFDESYRNHLSESISKSAKKLSNEYHAYKDAGGKMSWNDWLHAGHPLYSE